MCTLDHSCISCLFLNLKALIQKQSLDSMPLPANQTSRANRLTDHAIHESDCNRNVGQKSNILDVILEYFTFKIYLSNSGRYDLHFISMESCPFLKQSKSSTKAYKPFNNPQLVHALQAVYTSVIY